MCIMIPNKDLELRTDYILSYNNVEAAMGVPIIALEYRLFYEIILYL